MPKSVPPFLKISAQNVDTIYVKIEQINAFKEVASVSKFSIYLKHLIDDHGETISAVARSIGVERTSIHKALSNDRILSYKTVQALARHFNLTLEDRREFFRLYDILLQGEEAYQNRQAVCDLLNDLSAIRFSATFPPEVSEIHLTDRLIKGEFAVRSAIRAVLIYEVSHTDQAEFCMFLPQRLDLTMELMELWLDKRHFCVNELLCFKSGKAKAAENLQLLKSVIPLCLASRGCYRPYYFCEAPATAALSPMSYYIVTPHYLIQIAEDLSTAQIREGEELVNCYSVFFQNLLLSCEPLTQCSSDIMGVLHEYITSTSPDTLQVMMTQPCPGRYITKDVILKYLKSDDMPYEQMFSLVEHHFSVLGNISKNYVTIFTEKGLMDLMKTRVLADLPPQYVPPLDAADIRQMMRMLHDEIDRGTIQGLIVRPGTLQLPDYLAIYVNPKTGLHIYTTNAFVFGAYCCNIHITEESICRLFQDFVQSLPGSPMVYSKEDTLHLIEQHISEMDTKENDE